MDLFDDKLYVGIVGSRRRDGDADLALTRDVFIDVVRSHFGPRVTLTNLLSRHVVIVSGGCPRGGDRFAELIAREYQIPTVIHLPDRRTHLSLEEPWRSTRQNYDRNELVARDSRDALIACVASDRTGGTEDTILRWLRIHQKRLRRKPSLC